MISLEEGLRTEALQVLTFWEHVVQIFGPITSDSSGALSGVVAGSSNVGGMSESSQASSQEQRYPNFVDNGDKMNFKGEYDEKNSKGDHPLQPYAPTGGFVRPDNANVGGEGCTDTDQREQHDLQEGVQRQAALHVQPNSPQPLVSAEGAAFVHKLSLSEPQDARSGIPRGSSAAVVRTHPNVPTFEVWLQGQLHLYRQMVGGARVDGPDERIRAALAHISTINLGAHAFDAVKAFFQRRNCYPPVKLFVAEGNEAVVKVLSRVDAPN